MENTARIKSEIDFTRWILGDLKFIFCEQKNSNLKIDTDDQFK